MAGTNAVSSGIKELIEKLKNDGVNKGQAEAKTIITDAEKKAEKLLSDAKQEADTLREEAKKSATAFKHAGEEELKMALRDSMLVLRKEVEKTFTKQLGTLINQSLNDKDMLGKIVLEIVKSAADKSGIKDSKQVEVLLPEKFFSVDDLRKNSKELTESTLTKLAMGITKESLKDGVTFKTSEKLTSGVKILVKDTKVEVDLSDKAVAEILLEHLQPRFRAALEGVAS